MDQCILAKGMVRIIAGEYRGRRIRVAARPGLRPTPDRVRETLFNWLGQWLDGLSVASIFSPAAARSASRPRRAARRAS